MTIGEALKEEQKRLGLTSEAMAAGVISKGTYSKVVNNKQRLSSDLLVKILFKHEIDIDDFFEMLKSTYMPKEKIEEQIIAQRFKLALDNHDVQQAKLSAYQLNKVSNNEYLLWQFKIALAYLQHTENKLTDKFKTDIINEINQNDNWTENIDALRLLTNSMQILSVERVNAEMRVFFHRILRFNNIPENMQERYAIVCDNYLHFLFNKRVKSNKDFSSSQENAKLAIDYLCSLDSSAHLMIYKISGKYYKYLFGKKIANTKRMKQQLLAFGLTAGVKNWPI